MKKKYGLRHVLRPGAPPEAVQAWLKDALHTREAEARGEILDW